MKTITEAKKEQNIKVKSLNIVDLVDRLNSPNVKNLLKKCYQCARCSGVCQLSKVQKFTPSRIIQKILEGFESEVLKSGILWDCLMCNSCLQNCPEDINFADIVRIAKNIMIQQHHHDADNYTSHKGIYLSISQLMSTPEITPKRNLDWIPKDCKISDKGEILYHVGCLPFFKFEFDDLDSIAISTIKMLSMIEKNPVVVLKDEYCCGHDLYWGHGNTKAFVDLALKNKNNFKRAGISTILTTCAEGYRTFKVDYPKIIEGFNEKYRVKHIIEYIHEKWKEGIIVFQSDDNEKENGSFTFHDPCRLSRFLPKDDKIMEMARDIFNELKKIGFKFREMAHNKKDALCCGIGSWSGCNERSKALRYKRLLEAKEVASKMITTCPKCIMHFRCLQKDYEDIASVKVLDFTEFIIKLVILKEV